MARNDHTRQYAQRLKLLQITSAGSWTDVRLRRLRGLMAFWLQLGPDTKPVKHHVSTIYWHVFKLGAASSTKPLAPTPLSGEELLLGSHRYAHDAIWKPTRHVTKLGKEHFYHRTDVLNRRRDGQLLGSTMERTTWIARKHPS